MNYFHEKHKKNSVINVIGRSCRLPGAANIVEFWNVLKSERCTVTEMTPERFSMFRYKNARQGELGKSYSFAAGILDDIWGFDPAVFAILPREALQMDPQQRLLLMLVWEAFEDAGLPLSSLEKRSVGVYVGNSGIDHNNRFLFDPAGSDSYMMTGNTGALISNRISYIFDLHGPSMTLDTACSSSLVALDEAVNALRSGKIDTAIVAGVNLLLSPFPFVGFSAASMLSPEGLCRPFDKDAYGYVRAEGGVVLILQRDDINTSASLPCHSQIIATGVNSDGRTSGVALPSADYQARLLEQVYGEAGIDPKNLAFVEAHGTGTRVGDPAEATALGNVLGQARSTPLPIGSVKSNIGHLEPASGIVGLLKSMLALEHNLFPASLHFETPNPDIPFEDLNLKIAGQSCDLSALKHADYAGISNFGFGGTNVHTIIKRPPVQADTVSPFSAGEGGVMMISAHCTEALQNLSADYSKIITAQTQSDKSDDKTLDKLAAAVINFRTPQEKQLVVTGQNRQEIAQSLLDFSEGKQPSNIVTGTAESQNLDIVFVYSGNGAQWPGMGRVAYAENTAFRKRFEEVDALFQKLSPSSGKPISIIDIMHAEDVEDQMNRVEVAQQLLFAVQCGLTAALKALGLNPSFVVGHSAGEIAAAEASGALTLAQAAEVIHMRSKHQETMHGLGTMAVLLISEEKAREALKESGLSAVQIAAVNSPRAVTISGPTQDVTAFLKQAKKRRWACKDLGLEYPFHNSLIDPVKEDFLADLSGLTPSDSTTQFISSVTGKALEGHDLDTDYWWQNVRQPVQFINAITAAAEAGGRVFLEISPRPISMGFLNDILGSLDVIAPVLTSLNKKDSIGIDPIRLTFGRCITNGGKANLEKAFGTNPTKPTDLPLYPWQNKPFKLTPKEGAIEAFILKTPPHPLLGQQIRKDDFVWDIHLDTGSLPFLKDHKVDGKTVVPGAALSEMAMAAAAQWLKNKTIEIRDMDIIQPLILEDSSMREVRTRLSIESGTLEISSKKRLSDEDWQIHAKCRVAAIPGNNIPDYKAPKLVAGKRPEDITALYNFSKQHGIDYGPYFQRMIRCEESEDNIIEVVLNKRDNTADPDDGETSQYMLHPLDLDGCFHGLNILYNTLALGSDRLAFIPIRFGVLRVYQPQTDVRTARIRIIKANKRGGQGHFELFSKEGLLVATLEDIRFRAVALVKRHSFEKTSYSVTHQRVPFPSNADKSLPVLRDNIQHIIAKTKITETQKNFIEKTEEHRLLLDAAVRRTAYDIIVLLANQKRQINPTSFARSQGFGDNSESRYNQDHPVAIIASLLSILEQSEMASFIEPYWQIVPRCDFPEMADLLQVILLEEPSWLPYCVLLNHARNLLPKLLLEQSSPDLGEKEAEEKEDQNLSLETQHIQDIYSLDMVEQLTSSSPLAALHIKRVTQIVTDIVADWPTGQPCRILELGVGSGGLTKKLIPLLSQKKAVLIAADTNQSTISRLKMNFSDNPFFKAVVLDNASETLDNIGKFDLLVSANGLHFLKHSSQILVDVAARLADGGVSVLSVSEPDSFHNLVFSPVKGWLDWQNDPLFTLDPMKYVAEWQSILKTANLKNISLFPLYEDLEDAHLIVSSAKLANTALLSDHDAEEKKTSNTETRNILVLTTRHKPEIDFIDALSQQNFHHDHNAKIVPLFIENEDIWQRLNTNIKNNHKFEIVYLAQCFQGEEIPYKALLSRIVTLTKLLQTLGSSEARLWIIAPGGARAITQRSAISPVQTAVWAYARTAMNEYGDLDIRLIDFASNLDTVKMAEKLCLIMSDPGSETEMVLTDKAMEVLRVRRGLPMVSSQKMPSKSRAKKAQNRDPKITLSNPVSGSLDQIFWVMQPQTPLKPHQVEIRVEATGLNFRDVMWAQGLLPEEALEKGFAGPTLGLECSGYIHAIGKNVKTLKLDDRVMALASAGFSSHMTISQQAVVKIPDNLNLTAAATIPVAFLTAYYALHHLASLEEGEWVLIHGGAGGVGIAAIQLAKWKKAKIIATAGNDEKRNFLKMLGADYVLNTRSLDFVDQVREITQAEHNDKQGGVDVVLNSLFGEAMERSLELLRPFGRFLELGKRDFYSSTKVSLRPFRQNLSYFGIDADQLLNHQPALSKRLLAEVMGLFERGDFKPLPYRLFESNEMVEAFRLMQKSGHIGKIVIQAPKPQEIVASHPDQKFEAAPKGHHIIIGGLGGFGLEAARWLADHGAGSIILTSRTGHLNKDAQNTLETLKKAGVNISVACCDVTDKNALSELLTDLRKDQPIKGVMHAAMVLEDELIQNLTEEQIEKVLRPKVEGAFYLDALTKTDHLDYCVFFSSAAAMFGNPGQAHYVAANAYLNGLAQKRTLAGQPALAVGWGAITDVGVLTRQEDTAQSLARHTGGVEFKGRQGLDLLGQLLVSHTKPTIEQASIVLAAMNWSFVGDALPIMKSPSFTLMAQEAQNSGGHAGETIDLLTMIEGLDDAQASDKIAKLLAGEVSTIFRMPVEDINLKRSLSEIGMDSLMGMELRTAAQQKLGIDVPMVSIADGITIYDIATKVLSRLRNDDEEESGDDNSTDEMLATQHMNENMDKENIRALAGKVREQERKIDKLI